MEPNYKKMANLVGKLCGDISLDLLIDEPDTYCAIGSKYVDNWGSQGH